jgi:antitoxin (DNA-binding transcriptional repressor) of toxin-antitoxin stability system
MGIEMSVTEFKAKCLDLFDKLSRNEIESISVTKRGKPLACVTPLQAQASRTRESLLADYREWQRTKPTRAIQPDPDLDLIKPVFGDYEDFNAFHGKLLSQDE